MLIDNAEKTAKNYTRRFVCIDFIKGAKKKSRGPLSLFIFAPFMKSIQTKRRVKFLLFSLHNQLTLR